MAITVRPIQTEDLAQIIAIERATQPSPWQASHFADWLSKPGIYLSALLNGEIMGFILLSCVEDEAEILTLSIKPEFQSNGYGKQLLEAAIKMAIKQGVKNFFLEVRETNTAAISLYESAGFKPTGRRKSYYSKPGGGREDALMMGLDAV